MKLSAGWRGDRGQGLWGSNLRGAGRGAPTPAGTRGAGHQRFFTRAAVGLQCGLSPGPHESLLGQLAPDSLWLRPHRVSLCPVAPPPGVGGGHLRPCPGSQPLKSTLSNSPASPGSSSTEKDRWLPTQITKVGTSVSPLWGGRGGSGSREVVRLTETDVPERSCWLRG